MSNISLNYAQIIDPLSFKSINLAKIYIGEYGTLPNPANAATWKQAYFVNSDGTRTAASQPIRTNAAGFAVDGSGNIKTVQVDGGYSLLVQDQFGATKFSTANSADIWSDLAKPSGASLIGLDLPSTLAATTVQRRLDNLEIFADVATDGSDVTAQLFDYIAAAKAANINRVRLPAGTIGYSDTLVNDSTVELMGAGRDKTILKFLNATPLKPAVKFIKGSSKSCWAHFTLADGTFGTSRGVELYDTVTGAGSPVWKNVFFGVEISGFAESHAYTSDNPLSGANHAHCSENLWLHCRFVNNKVLCLNQNSQAVNNHYIHCDGENFDTTYFGSPVTDANFEMFRDEAGGGVIVSGGSWIGRGKLFSWKYPAGGSNLFSGATFTAKDLRMELRTTHNGVIVNEDVHGNTGSSLYMDITLKDINTVNYNATIDLIAFGGRVNAIVDNVKVVGGAGKLQIKQYPTIGRSASTTTGSQGTIDVVNSDAIEYVKATTSPYGTYNADYVARVSFQGQGSASTNSSFSTDADGWSSLNGGSDTQQLGMRLGYCRPFGRLTVASDAVSSGLAGDFKVIMPKGGRPLRLFAYKHPQQFANNVGFELYLAKDKANWVNPASFDYLTDAVLVAAMPTTANKAGYFEIDAQLVSNSLGNQLQAGFGSWTEGRMFLRKIGANPFPGFVGVEYI